MVMMILMISITHNSQRCKKDWIIYCIFTQPLKHIMHLINIISHYEQIQYKQISVLRSHPKEPLCVFVLVKIDHSSYYIFLESLMNSKRLKFENSWTRAKVKNILRHRSMRVISRWSCIIDHKLQRVLYCLIQNHREMKRSLILKQ